MRVLRLESSLMVGKVIGYVRVGDVLVGGGLDRNNTIAGKDTAAAGYLITNR